MAKLPVATFYDAYNTADIDTLDLFIASGTKSRMVAIDTSSFDMLVFEGRNFKYEDGRPSSGIVEKVSVVDTDGTVTQTITGMKIEAGQLAGDTISEFTNSLVQRLYVNGLKFVGSNLDDVLSGSTAKDFIRGRGGDDDIDGAGGRDILTGGAGSDEFNFFAGIGRDVITDFDANGGPGAQDFIDGTFADATISQSGKNAIVDFGSGDMFVLRGVDADDLTVADFV